MRITAWGVSRFPWAWATSLQAGGRACGRAKSRAAQGIGATKGNARCAQKARMGQLADSPQSLAPVNVWQARTVTVRAFKLTHVLVVVSPATGVDLDRRVPLRIHAGARRSSAA